MATCGNCKATHVSVSHVRECYRARNNFGAGYRVVSDNNTFSGYAAEQSASPASTPQPATNVWSKVNSLRSQIAKHLAPKPSGKAVGYFAVNLADGMGGAPVKFYRVTRTTNGRTFLDAQASDEYHSVRTPQANELVLGRILGDPAKAAALYASSLGRCYRCGRTLTDETSRSVGMGPECRSKL